MKAGGGKNEQIEDEKETRPNKRPIISLWRLGRGTNASGQGQGGAVKWLGRSNSAQKSLLQAMSRHPKFRVALLPTYRHTL